jgi:serine/threonine protein kinase
MTEVMTSSLVAGLDACDLVDASDVANAAVSISNGLGDEHKPNNKNADFEDFTQSTTLIGETLEEAQAAAAEAIAVGPTATEAAGPNGSSRSSIERDRRDFSTAQRDHSTTAEHQTTTAATTITTTITTTAVDSSKKAELGDSNSKQNFVTPKDFELLKVIGMGAFGKVLQVRNKQSKQILAMKIISKRQLRKKSGYIENIRAERNILKRVNHPFVVKMHCSFQTREKLFILMDFLAGGELFLRLGREGVFLEKDAAFYLAETILALDHLHTLGILHRDLKPENILLCNDGHICLTDFGLAKDFGTDWSGRDGSDDQERARTICGTQEYM